MRSTAPSSLSPIILVSHMRTHVKAAGSKPWRWPFLGRGLRTSQILELIHIPLCWWNSVDAAPARAPYHAHLKDGMLHSGNVLTAQLRFGFLQLHLLKLPAQCSPFCFSENTEIVLCCSSQAFTSCKAVLHYLKAAMTGNMRERVGGSNRERKTGRGSQSRD